jgi:hypothetical protein
MSSGVIQRDSVESDRGDDTHECRVLQVCLGGRYLAESIDNVEHNQGDQGESP